MRRRDGAEGLRDSGHRQGEGLDDLWQLLPAPGIDDTVFDLHEGKSFKVRDFIVIRWRGGNLIASPYFAHTGGMAVDFMESAPDDGDQRKVVVNAQGVRDLDGKK